MKPIPPQYVTCQPLINKGIIRWMCLCIMVILFYGITSTAQDTYVWDGGTGNWSDNNWGCIGGGCGSTPGVNDNAIIDAGTVTIDAEVTISSLTLSGSPEINGTHSLTVTSSLIWKGCNFYDVPVTVEGTLDLTDEEGFGRYIYGAATFTLNGTTNHSYGTIFIYATTSIINNGTFNISGSGQWHLNNGIPSFSNESTMNISKNGAVISGPQGSFTNETMGIINFTGGTSHTFSTPFTNAGAINYNSGSLLDFNNTFNHNGTLTLNGGATLEMSGGTIATTSSWSGGGGLKITSGPPFNTNINLPPPANWALEFAGGTNNLNISTTVSGLVTIKNDCTVQGTGPLVANGDMTWESGTITSIPVTLAGTLDMTGGGSDKTLGGTALLTLQGTTNHAVGRLFLNTTASILNTASATYNLSGGAYWQFQSSDPSFINEGIVDVSKDGTVISGFDGTFTNSSTGIFRLSGSTGSRHISRPFINEGQIEGKGILNLNSTFTQIGILEPGASPGILGLSKLDNNSGTLHIEMQDDADGNPATTGTPGTDYDQVAVTAAGTLGGLLDITYLSGYLPSAGNQFTIMTCNPCSGAFSNITYPNSIAEPDAWDVNIIGNEVILEYVFVLPVELVNFNATIYKEQVQLNWETASELNNQGFEIQKSSDGKEWKKIGYVTGNGTTYNTNNYQLVDPQPFNGINYYRLKQIDFDGSFKYSTIKSAIFSKQEEINIYPNPAIDYLKINGLENGKIKIYDAIGKKIKEETFFNSNISISELKNGIYLIQIFSDKFISTKKIMK